MSGEMSDEQRVGAAHRGGRMDSTHGIQALHEKSPLDHLIEFEEGGERDLDLVRLEAMRSFMNYLFADSRPEELVYALMRVYAVARGFYPSLLDGVTRDQMEEIFSGAYSVGALNWKEGLGRVLEGDHFEVRDATVGRLMFFFFVDERPGESWFAMRRVYALAKAFVPEALHGMSLHEMGAVFDEGSEAGARARWSHRVKRWMNAEVEKAGGVAHLKFQKSATTCGKYAAAQKGNQNRKKKS